MPSILFVCTGNQYRSPVAAAAFRKQLQRLGIHGWVVESAGTWVMPGLSLPAHALRLAAEFGFDLSDHRTHVVNEPELAKHDLVLVMEQGQKEALRSEFPWARGKVYLLSEVVGAGDDIPDPADPRVDAKQVAALVVQMIERGSEKIIEMIDSISPPQRSSGV